MIPSTIVAHWEHFESVDIPSNAPQIQRDAMRQAFYAGAASGLLLTVQAFKDDLPGAIVARLNAEISTWAAMIRARR
jgi:hypothetical protein